MGTRLNQFLLPLIGSLLVSTDAGAEAYFPVGHCGLAVAARPTIAEARQWIIENRWESSARVFLSSNGWYSITVGTERVANSGRALKEYKSSGTIPTDAYCTSGNSFKKEVSWQSAGNSENEELLWSEFDARPLSVGDKAFLQAGLALEGEYYGLLDGAWGRGSQSALERFSRKAFQREPLNADAALLSMLMFRAMSDEGWRRMPIEGLALSMVLPMKNFQLEQSSGSEQKWSHTSKMIRLYTDDYRTNAMATYHSKMAEDRELREAPYTVRNTTRWVTSGRLARGTFYIRSELIQGTWSTVTILAGNEYAGELALMTGSIAVGGGGPFLPDRNGALMRHNTALNEFLERDDGGDPSDTVASRQATPPPHAESVEREGNSSGTGFFVNDRGVLLTNAHVVEGCHELRVDGRTAKLLSKSTTFDLAAVEVPEEIRGQPLALAAVEPGLNADITIAGFPLHGLLGGLNVGRGSISSLKGLRGDETNLQISAPVQPGNSGGPMVDRYGNVVGVVVSKLDAVEVASVTGDIAQNVNFAIRGSMAMVFLQTNGIDHSVETDQEPLGPEAIAQELAAATRLIECRGR